MQGPATLALTILKACDPPTVCLLLSESLCKHVVVTSALHLGLRGRAIGFEG